MAHLSVEDGHLTVLNLFGAQTTAGQDRLIEVMTGIIDTADYPGWVSSTLHAGQDERGTANYIQWRSREDLEERYAGATFRHETVPEFRELSTFIRLLQTEVVFSQQNPTTTLEPVELTPDRGDHTVIVLLTVDPTDQTELVDTLAKPDGWLTTVPGYRSHSYLRGLDGTFLVNYAQWESKETYDAFHHLPENERPVDVRRGREIAGGLVTDRWSNTYRVVHTRSAP
ncbi:antibiotic biosynthesis monooxygenase family protein [Pseudonocardia endophytica]|uniref:Antibiotic biosynthesis monooxygenase n=1 Tax=Pseudonocardia endophytica TaxID=401976 RepID=A0A4R1HLU8_PSEEN|nr:antibiotic biosynthesis monooxygenase family protein [Pseudonocardia endophytica]TCK22081.1 antibiotic biosynthesis monooxygenase [Pseudonocardia endophytica]